MNKNVMRSDVISCLMWGSIAALLVMLISLIIPFYAAEYIAVIPLVIAIPVGMIMGIRHRKNDRDAALFIDGFGLDEKIITAYENQDFADRVCQLQRQDAEMSLRSKTTEIKVPMTFPLKKFLVFISMLLLCVVAYLIPTPSKQRAEERHKTKVAAKQAEKEVKEMLDELAKIDKGSLSPEELKELNKMMESLEASRRELKNSKTGKELAKAKEKYNYKLGDTSDRLGNLANGKSESASKQIKSAKEMADNQKKTEQEKMAKNNDQNQNGQNQNNQNQNGQNGNNQSQNGQNQNGDNQNQNGQNGNNQNGQNGNNQNQNGQNGDNQNQNSQNGNNQNQNSQNGNNQNQNGQNGNGQNQNGQQGQQNSQNGSGQGTGSGQGNSSGETDVSHNHDYVSVNKNVTGKYGDNSTSQYSREQNGLAWEGEKVPYDTVINEYSKTANEGISKGKYPGNMSDVVKNYFSDLSK
ncbi:MAG: hypothetical protein IKS48_11090 [Eubacterium sp.]|nr:hypothetical protein [Eubacterium sp.]